MEVILIIFCKDKCTCFHIKLQFNLLFYFYLENYIKSSLLLEQYMKSLIRRSVSFSSKTFNNSNSVN